jgi:type VI secretion system secreted protein Hcp
MGQKLFLKIINPQIKGEATDDRHKDEIEVLSWFWEAAFTILDHAGGGAGGGKPTKQNLSIIHYIDKATPVLMHSCLSGQKIQQAILTAKNTGTPNTEFFKMTIDDIRITSVTPRGEAGAERMTETVTLIFNKITEEYIYTTSTGHPDPPIKSEWDFRTNR